MAVGALPWLPVHPDPPPSSDPAPTGTVRRPLADGRDDLLIREEALMIHCHGAELLTMRTPGRDADLALGFLLAEGVIGDAAEVASIHAVPAAGDVEEAVDAVHVELHQPNPARIQGRLARTHEVRPSCGVCGAASPAALLDELPALLPGAPRVSLAAVGAHARTLMAHQPLFAATGACHGAALFGPDGTLLGAAEDVGRHNALDKVIGAAARLGHPLDLAIALLSGRAGADLVLKCLRVRIPVIASVSAPSAFAFDLCRAAGATLIGFVRDGRAQVYCGTDRLLDTSPRPPA